MISDFYIDLDDYYIKKVKCVDCSDYDLIAQKKEENKEYYLLSISKDVPKDSIRQKWYIYPRKVISSLNLSGIVQLEGFRFPLTNIEKEVELKRNPIKFKLEFIRNKRTTNVDIDTSGIIYLKEYMKVYDLRKITSEYLQSKGKMNEFMNPTIRSKIIFGIAATMKRIHQKNIIFHDLMLQNICLDFHLEPRINLFEILPADYYSPQNFHAVGNPLYLAPETYEDGDEDYSQCPSIDVYSYAMILYEMFSIVVTFADKIPISSSGQCMMKISRGARPRKPENIPEPYWELIQRCWNHVPGERPTFEEITEILKRDEYAIEEFGMKTNLDELREYQSRIDRDPIFPNVHAYNRNKEKLRLQYLLKRKLSFNWMRH